MVLPNLYDALSTLFLLIFLGTLIYLHKRRYALGTRITAGLVLGLLFGLVLRGHEFTITQSLIQLIGGGYLALLKLLVVPIIFTSLVNAILHFSHHETRILAQLSLRTVSILLLMTATASGIGLLIGLLFNVGAGMHLPEEAFASKYAYTGIVDSILGFIPSNPFKTLAEGNTIAIVILSLFIGFSALVLAKADRAQAEPFKQVIQSAFQVSKKLANLIIGLSPYGVLALLTQVTMHSGFAVLLGILTYMGAIFVAILVLFIMHLIIVMTQGYSPVAYLKKASPALLVAFSTRSSLGTLPVTEETLEKRFHLQQITSTFVPSIGATLGMNACAGIFPALLVVMTLTMLGEPITPMIFLSVMLINMVASLGISGIPGTANVAATVTLTALGLPYASVALVQGVDSIVDMARTAANVNGVITTAIVVDKHVK